MRWICIVGLVLGGCVDSTSVPCGDIVCPGGTQCVSIMEPDVPVETVCAEAPQVEACKTLTDHHRCTTTDIADGRCYGGACLPVACGNGRKDAVDPTDPTDLVGEICDKGDQMPGDGCSADCASLETCGNGTTDLIMGEQCDDANLVSHDGCSSDCRQEAAHWSRLTYGTPSNRTSIGLAYDAAHHQTLLFGGAENATFGAVGDTWLWDGIGWAQLDLPVSPSPRSAHSMAYDASRQRVVLFGGTATDGTALSDTWEWDGTHWTRINTLTIPPARINQAMAYDAKRKRVVMFGGIDRTMLNPTAPDHADTWLFDGANWTKQVTTKWPDAGAPVDPANGRDGSVMAFDPARGVIVLFGGASRYGSTSATYDTSVWELDATDWHKRVITSASPPGRDASALAYDLIGQRMLLVGGNIGGTEQGDEWALSGAVWTQLSPSTAPEARVGHSMVTDTSRGRVVLFGGYPVTYSMWEWNGTSWSAPATASPPVASWVGSYDPLRGRAVLATSPRRTFELHDTSLTEVIASLPVDYREPSFAYDRLRKRTVMFDIDASNNGATALFDGTAWSSPATVTPRLFQGVIAPDANGDIVLFGGFDLGVSAITNATWTWNGTTWTLRNPAHKPPPRLLHAMAYDPSRHITVMLGGASATGALDDTWAWDGNDWTEITAPGPTARTRPSLAWHATRGRLVLFGGAANSVSLDDTWEFDGTTWSPVSAGAAPRPRSQAVLVPEPDRGGMLLFGGLDPQAAPLADTWVLRWDSSDRTEDRCSDAIDFDNDGLAGCNDPDCYFLCAPLCTPGPELATCEAMGPSCGDGMCNTALETCRSCAADCSACAVVCGDLFCDAPETAASCPGDCP